LAAKMDTTAGMTFLTTLMVLRSLMKIF